MTSPLVFLSRTRLYWLEAGQLWRWHLVLWKWWPVPAAAATRISGTVMNPDEVNEVRASFGSPMFPRVEAGAWLPCAQCGEVCGVLRVYLGVRPFCSTQHREQFLRARPVVDAQVTSGADVRRHSADPRTSPPVDSGSALSEGEA